MPGLVCSAQSCVYNDAMYCSRGNIEVGGADARVCQDTCCESFQGRSGDSAKNTMKSGCTCTQSDIRCEATNCMHNPNLSLIHISACGTTIGTSEVVLV